MAVYIKGMKKPTNCLGCVCCHVDEVPDDRRTILKYTCIVNKITSVNIDRLYWFCPMLDVKEPHGRLVEADELNTAHYHYSNGNLTGVWYGCTENELKDAPTIIPKCDSVTMNLKSEDPWDSTIKLFKD